MSETLQTREQPARKDIAAELGCGACVFAQLGCVGKKPTGECPPTPEKTISREVIAESQFKDVLFDPNVAAVSLNTTGEGGLVVQREKAAKLQTPIPLPAQPVAKKATPAQGPPPVARPVNRPSSEKLKRGNGFERTFGEFVMKLFGGDVSQRRKK